MDSVNFRSLISDLNSIQTNLDTSDDETLFESVNCKYYDCTL